MLATREVTNLKSLCPAAYPVGETPAGSAVLCRVTGRIVATGTDASSLAAFCCHPRSSAVGETSDGQIVAHGYEHCPSWKHNRDRELRAKIEWAEGTPDRVKDGLSPEFITRA